MAESGQQQAGGRRWLAGAALMAAACGVAAGWFMLAEPRVQLPGFPSPSQVRSHSRNAGSAEGHTDSGSAPTVAALPPAAQRPPAGMDTPAADGAMAGGDESMACLAAARVPDDLPQVLGRLLRPDSEEDERDRGLQRLRSWADTDPKAAAAWLDGQPALAGRGEAVEQVASAWAGQALEEAGRWAGQLPTAEERQRALQAVVYEGAGSHPTVAMTLAIQGLPAGTGRDALLLHATAQWASAEPAEALAWARQLSDTALRDPIIATVATEWSERDPVAGATLAIEQLPAGRLQNDALVSIVERWVQVDPRAAAGWVATGLPEGELRATAMTELIKIWAEQDVEAAGQWLADLKAGPLRETALTAYACKLLPHAAVIAAELSVPQADPKARDTLAVVAVEEWLKGHTLAAETWDGRSPLTPGSKEQLLMALQ